jgi:hypothetical protein
MAAVSSRPAVGLALEIDDRNDWLFLPVAIVASDLAHARSQRVGLFEPHFSMSGKGKASVGIRDDAQKAGLFFAEIRIRHEHGGGIAGEGLRLSGQHAEPQGAANPSFVSHDFSKSSRNEPPPRKQAAAWIYKGENHILVAKKILKPLGNPSIKWPKIVFDRRSPPSRRNLGLA